MPRLARSFAEPQSLRQMFGLDPEPGHAPSNIAFNDYLASIPKTSEQNREAGVLAEMDARTNASMATDRAESEAVREARNRGFQGSYPLQEQEQYGADQKLRQILLPKQYELEAKMLENQTGREFNASQHAMDRESRERIASGAQAGQTGRVAAQQAAIGARAEAQRAEKLNPIHKLYNWMTGNNATPAPAVSGDKGSGMVMMEAPTGEQQMVPVARVQEFLAKGATVVE